MLIAVGLAAFYLDVAVDFRFEFIEQHYEAFGVCILLGVVATYIGCIAWARTCDRRGRAVMAVTVLSTPLVALLIGSCVDGLNMHGPSGITAMLIPAASVLALILFIMAAVENKPRSGSL